MKNIILALFCGLFLLIWPTHPISAKPEVIVAIVNKSNPLDGIQSKKLARIYRGRMTKWPDGQRIVVINRPFDSKIRALFYELVLGAGPTKRFFKPGTPIPFKMMNLRSGIATRKFVARIPNAVGYIYLSEVDDTVKVLKIGGIAPGKKGYLLN